MVSTEETVLLGETEYQEEMENLEFVWDTPVPEKQSKRGRPIFFGKK
jgi:hypothetical protein